jgi:hypothetical protein
MPRPPAATAASLRLSSPLPPRGALRPALALLVLLGACQALPEGDQPANTVPPRLAERLPPALAGFERGPVVPVADGGGVEVPYATRGLRAAAATLRLLPAAPGQDPAAPPAADEAALPALLRDLAQAGPHRRIAPRGAPFSVAAAGTPRLACQETEGTYGRERVDGLVCAGRHGASQVRLRLAMPRTSPPAADARGFAAAMAQALATPPGAAVR